MDQACRWVIKYFFLLTWQCCVEWFNLDHAVVTAVFVSGVVVCQLVCRLAVDILNIILVTHCSYADLLTNLTLNVRINTTNNFIVQLFIVIKRLLYRPTM